MSRTPMCRLNAKALKAELMLRNITLADASRMIGRERDHLTRCIRDERISKATLDRIHKRFFIDPESLIAAEEPKEEPEQLQMSTEEVALDDIREAVAQGVSEGMRRYFERFTDGKRAEPVAALTEKWKMALYGMEEEL